LTPSPNQIADKLLSPPPRGESTARFGPAAAADDREVDPRVAVSPSHFSPADAALTSSTVEVAAQTPALIPATLAPRFSPQSSGVDLNRAPPDQLLAAAWKQIGGTTVIDQSKTVLAGIGLLSLLVVFWRIGRQREPEHEEE
jgi:hypothetical protein